MILVTGASGLLGTSILTRAPQRAGGKVVGIARSRLRVGKTAIQQLDLTTSAATQEFIYKLHPSTVIHCAAATDVDWCEDHPDEAHEINVIASQRLAQLAQELDAQFVYVSTDSVFDGHEGNYRESDIPHPLNVYAETKLSAERAVLKSHSSPLIVRVNFYGSKKGKLADWIVDQLSTGKPIPGFTDVFFCPLLAQDLGDVIFEMLDAELTGIYHVVGSEKISKYEFAVRLATIFGFNPDLVSPSLLNDAKLRAARPRDLSLSSAKVSAALDRAMPDVDSGLQKFKRLRDSGCCQDETPALQ
jgi:dTDP-4-dehydrorhamnose reductase